MYIVMPNNAESGTVVILSLSDEEYSRASETLNSFCKSSKKSLKFSINANASTTSINDFYIFYDPFFYNVVNLHDTIDLGIIDVEITLSKSNNKKESWYTSFRYNTEEPNLQT